MTRPYPDNPGQTHYPGCWRERGHHNCAVAIIDELIDMCLFGDIHEAPIALVGFFSNRSYAQMDEEQRTRVCIAATIAQRIGVDLSKIDTERSG